MKAVYYRLAARRGKPRAAVAVGRKILELAYLLLRRRTTYAELGEDYHDQRDPERTTNRLVRRREALGYNVSLTLREVVDSSVEALGGARPASRGPAPVGMT